MTTSLPTPDPGPRIPALRAWLLAARPKTLAAAAAPVVVGCACAATAGQLRLLPALATLAGALLIQVGTNLWNDVADFERGTDTAARLGPTRATLAGLLTPGQVRAGTLATFGLAVVVGVYLALVAGWPVVVIGAASILAGLAYTGGPWPLSHHGWGEPFVLVFFGFVAVAGTVFVQLGRVPPSAWWAGLVTGSFSVAILVINNVRDHATDRAAGRTTIPARFGRRAGIGELVAFLVLAHLGTLGMAITSAAPVWVLIAELTIPQSILLVQTVAGHEDGPTLNATLGRAGQLLLLHAALLAAALVLTGAG
jgi:1,4-dihydroxy-2-naphthoate polyprenyltransferase